MVVNSTTNVILFHFISFALSLSILTFLAIRAMELQGYVEEVREEIRLERKEAKLAAAEEKRRLQREARQKERERRLQALLDKDGKAIEGAEEEVKMLQQEIENYKRGGRNAQTPAAKDNAGALEAGDKEALKVEAAASP